MLLRTVAAVGIAVAVLAACATVPVYNVDKNAVTTASGKTPTAAEVRGAILAAGGALGWSMSDAGPGLVRGNIALRSHTAAIEIPYSEKAYSIVYKSSTNLDESGGKIHKNYNGWIQNLERGINARITTLN